MEKKPFTTLQKFLIIAGVLCGTGFVLFAGAALGGHQLNITLPQASTTAIALDNGLTGHFTFDGATMTSNVGDSSPSGNNAQLANFTSTTTVSGAIGQALEFDGSGDYVAAPAATIGNGSKSVSLWIKTTDAHPVDTHAALVSKWGAAVGRNFILWINGANLEWGDFNSSEIGWIGGGTTISDGNWHHIVAIRDGSNGSIYVDGVLRVSETGTFSDTTSSGNILLGTYYDGSGLAGNVGRFGGKMDDVRLYNRALSTDEITRLYKMGATSKINVTLPQASTTAVALDNGLVGHWTFDGEKMGSNVADSSTAGNNGQLSGFTSTTTASGKIGQALEFNGSSQYVFAPYTASLNPATTLSWGGWVKPTGGQGSFRSVVSSRDASVGSNRRGYILYAGQTNTWECWVGNGSNSWPTVTGGSVTLNKWHHVICTYDGTTMRLYVDGVLLNSGAVTYSPNTSKLFLIGAGANETPITLYFPGSLDDIRLYNRTLSAEEVTRLYKLGATTRLNQTFTPPNLESGLVGHWSFDGDKLLTDVTDSSGQGNNGQLSNFTATTTVSGRIGQALEFNGGTNAFSIGQPASLRVDYITAAAWVRFDNPGEETIMGSDLGGTTGNWAFYQLNATTLRFFIFINGSAFIKDTSVTPVAGEWYHVIATHDGSNMRVYINGVDQGSPTAASGVIDKDSVGIYIGADGNSDHDNFDGVIDDARIYNRALSANEVKLLYSMGR